MFEKIKKIWKKNNRGNKMLDIEIGELKALDKNGAILLDVRSPQEYEEGHLGGAILKNKKEVIIVYCSSGIRSKKAQKELMELGYEYVYNLKGGLEN